MVSEIKTIVFDLDGTIYQNTVFHRDYLRFLVEGTQKAGWADVLIAYADGVFLGKHLAMNAFYETKRIDADSPLSFFRALENARLPALSYEEALLRDDCVYTGDAWAVVTLLGLALGLLEGDRGDLIYRRTRDSMSADGMKGNARLREVIRSLGDSFETVLLSNSPAGTALEFLEQLAFHDVFQKTMFSANKPAGMLDALRSLDVPVLEHPQSVLSIGDHAYNDFAPLQRLGCRTLWVNPFRGIREPACDASVRTPDDLAEFLERLRRCKFFESAVS